MAKLNLIEEGVGPIILDDKDYLSGGEGKVYTLGNKAYKVYHDPKCMIPVGKIQELKPIIGQNVLGPQSLLYDKKNNPVGFTMKYVNGTIALTNLFSTGFRNRNNITPEMSVEIVQKMMSLLNNIHQNNILVVDGNEFNYLIDEKTFIEPYFIDVDSYQTKSYPAKVLMPSVKDWHTKGFNILSDWFSFGVVACQIFVGIHPYKGTHPDYSRTDLEGRMKNNISVFNKQVSLPPPARSFDLIPSDLRDWMINMFEKGARTLPPMLIAGRIVKSQITKIFGGIDQFIIDEILKNDESIFNCQFYGNNLVVFGEKEIKFGKFVTKDFPKNTHVIFTPSYKNPIAVYNENGTVNIRDLYTNQSLLIACEISADKLMILENRPYVVKNDNFTEIKFQPLGDKVIPGYGNTWKILPKSSHLFDGFMYSDVLGTSFLYIPYQSGSMEMMNIPELDGYKIVDGKYENGVCIMMVYKKGTYDRIIIKFDFSKGTYQYDLDVNVTQSSINFVTLDNGVTVLVTGDNEVQIFHKAFGAPRKIITNANIPGDAVLFKDINRVLFYLDEKVYTFQMKK